MQRDQHPASAAILAGGGEMGALMRSLAWSATLLGPVTGWPQSLRTAVSICLASRFPMLVWWGSDLVMLYNDAYRPLIGTKHPRAMGQCGRECFPEIWDVIGPMLTGVLTEGAATWSEDQLLLLDRNGYREECYFTFSYSPIRDETGGIGGVFTAVTETTSRVLGERRLGTLRALADAGAAQTIDAACRAAMDALAGNPADIPFALLYLLDDDGAHARLAGSAHLAAGTMASPTIVALDANAADDSPWPLAPTLARGTVHEVADPAAIGPLPGGPWPESPRHALIFPVALSGEERPAGVLVVGVSPRRALDDAYRAFFTLVVGQIATVIASARTHEAERQRAEALAALDRAKTAFFSNVSHEFRTPLTLMLGPIAEVLRDEADSLSPAQRAQLETVHRNGLRLQQLVNTLLDFSRIEAGRVRAVYEPTDLAAYTGELASVFRAAMEQAGLEYVVDCPPLTAPVYVDREMWEKVVLNLLSNAFKFTLSGAVIVRVREEEGRAILTVSDSGTGIPADELPHLLERFHRVRDALGRTFEGSGIGLALVRELVELHGGTVGVTSAVGRGTTFTVRLPLGAAHLPAAHIRAGDAPAAASAGATAYEREALRWLAPVPGEGGSDDAPHGVAPPARVLLADDNADMRDYVRRLLGTEYTVETVADGEAALAAARDRPPDLVLSDVMMPRLDGFGLLRALRADPRTREIPVVLLSARAGEEATVEGLEAGADDYLIKPFAARELLARVHAHIETARIRRAAGREREAFLASISHDLRTPLTSIRGYTQLARRRLTRSAAAESGAVAGQLAQIEAATTRMLTLINDLMDISRLRHGVDLELRRTPTDVAALVGEIIARQRTVTPQHIVFETPDAALSIRADAGQLERVVMNLLSNATKYSPTTSVIAVRVARADPPIAAVAITMTDQGIGIPAADLPHIFERFRRAGNVIGKVPGWGIGLASARQIVEQHGGTITVASEEGRGSVFTVRLPLG